MTYQTAKQASVREVCIVIEIDLDRNDPALDSTFVQDPNSYGTPKTTNDLRAYKEGEIITHRWSTHQVFGMNTFPCIRDVRDVRIRPAKVKPGQSIGDRATFNATLQDFISNDSYELPEPYKDGRQVTGSYFGKLVERNYLETRPIRVLRGYIENGMFVYETEHYIVDNFKGPQLDGTFEIEGRDVLSLTTSIKSRVPETTTGILALGIDETATSLTFNALDTTAEYGTSGYWSIGSEIMGYTITSSTSADITRGEFGSFIESHEINASIQKCDAFVNENIIDIIEYYLDLTEIPADYKDTVEWAALKAGDLVSFNLTNAIFKPTEIKKVLNELIQIGGLTMYVDVVAKKVKISALSNFDTPVIVLNPDEHYIYGTLRKSQKFDDKITRQLVRWAPRNYTEDKENNWAKNFRSADILQEDASRNASKSEGDDLKFKWLSNSVDTNQIASNIVQRNVQRFSILPVEYSVDIDSAYVGDLAGGGRFWIGSVYQMVIPANLGSADGLDKTVTLQCISIKSDLARDKYTITGLAYNANIPPIADYYIQSGEYQDYDLAAEMTTAGVIDGAKDYIVVINGGARFGSSSTSTPAFTTGAFPAGSTLYIVNQGQIIGAGGNGGNGGPIDNESICTTANGQIGLDAGDAFDVTLDTTIDNTFGLIGGGGGGGAGGSSICPEAISGDGGGGGQGSIAGLGGAAGIILGGSATLGSSGEDGTPDAPGFGGSVGGGLGEDGADSASGISGGAAGRAIVTNGNTVTINGGNNAERIKGAVV